MEEEGGGGRNAINPKGYLVRQADSHASCQAVGPVGQSIWVDHSWWVGQRGRNAALNVHSALLGDSNGTEGLPQGSWASFTVRVGVYRCRMCVGGVRRRSCQSAFLKPGLFWAVWISGTSASICSGETISGWPLRLGSGPPCFRPQARV